jgi:hypothetical protein
MNGNHNIFAAELKTTEPKSFASMHEVVMKKDELVKALIENKAKHDALYEASVIGYWELAKEKLEEKKKTLDKAVEELKDDVNHQLGKLERKLEEKELLPHAVAFHGFRWDSSLGLQFPENHTKEYERAIRMMNASVYDEVKLSEHEFDSYVLNNWEWKNKFVVSNSLYLDKARGSSGFLAVSGLSLYSGALPTTTGSYYANARAEAFNTIGSNSLKF